MLMCVGGEEREIKNKRARVTPLYKLIVRPYIMATMFRALHYRKEAPEGRKD